MKQGKAGLSDEYARIYNELSAMNGIYATENMAMYTLTITVIGFGWEFESPFLLLLSFVILIPFQILLGGHLSTFLRNGAYLMVFHEADNESLSWEYALDYFETVVPRDLKRFRLQHMGSSILGMISLACSIVMFVRQLQAETAVQTEAVIILALTVCAEVATIVVNWYYVSGRKIKKRSNIYKRIFIETSILQDIRKDKQEHSGESKVKSLEKNLNRAYHKFKQYPPRSDDEILDYNVMLQDLIKELGISSPSATGIPLQSEKQKPVEINSISHT